MDLVVVFIFPDRVLGPSKLWFHKSVCVMSCVTIRGIILQFGSGCSLTDGPSVVKTVWREQKIGLDRSFTSNIHQQFHLSLTPCYLFWCCVFRRHIALISKENETYQSLVSKLLQIIGSSEVCWSLPGLSLIPTLGNLWWLVFTLKYWNFFARLICLYHRYQSVFYLQLGCYSCSLLRQGGMIKL